MNNLMKNAMIELEVDETIKNHNFYNINTKKTDFSKLYAYYKNNHSSDLSIYKLYKKSGFDYIVLYKKVAMVGIADFLSYRAVELKQLPEVNEWPTYQTNKLKRQTLINQFKEPYDKRTSHAFKPSAEKYWEDIKKFLINNIT